MESANGLGWWFGFLGSPHERDCYLGTPHRAPSHQFTPWKSSRPNKVAGLLDDPWIQDSLPMGKPFGGLGLPGLPLVYRILGEP